MNDPVRAWILLACLMISACGQDSDPGQALRMGLASAPVNLDPRRASDAASERVNRLLYRRLVAFDKNSRAIPSLASWEQLGPRHYRFTLGSDGRGFHNGMDLDANDVRATYQSILDPATASPHRATLEIIARVEAIGRDQVDFHLRREDALFPAYLAIGIVPADLIAAQHPFADHPVGSGPYRFVSRPHEGRLLLERLSDQQHLEFLEVKDPTVRVLKLLRGEIDMLQNDLPPELADYLAGRPEIQVLRAVGSNFSYLGFNLEDPVTGRIEVRRAIAHAIDRGAIIRYVLGSGATPAQTLLPPDHWAGAEDLPAYPYDTELAQRWLARTGYGPERRLELEFKTSSDPFRIRLATVIQDQLAKIGIDMRISSYDWGTFYGDIKQGRFQMYSLAWVGIKTPDVYRYVFHSESLPPAGANRGRYRSERADALIERAEEMPGRVAKAGLYRELQQLLLDDLPYIPLWYEDHFFASGRSIEGYRVARDGNYDGLTETSRRSLDPQIHDRAN